MDVRKKIFFSSLLILAALTSVGCALSQQPKAQLRQFTPPAPKPAAAVAIAEEAPATNPADPSYQPIALLEVTPELPRWTAGDSMMQEAEKTFEAGKKLYQAEDFSGARREFDDAIDQMVEASDLEPADRQDYQRRLDDMVESVHRLDAAGMGSAQNPDDTKFEKAPLEDILQMTFPVDPKLKNKVREQAAATVSQLPLTVNDTVLGYINFFSNRGRGTLAFATQRSGRYRPMIQRVLDEEGVPQELIHLAQAESGFMPRARSSMAAVGMWQFVAFRGAEYGLNRTAYVDDRMDPEKSTRAAARHLHDLYNEFGDWYLAIAAYNCGPNVVEDAVARTGYADFWELRNRGVLPAETTNYVPIILAMTIIEKNAAEYGLDLQQMDAPLDYDTVDIVAPTSLALVSDITDTPLPQLVDLNPALLHGIAPEGYPIHVPKGSGTVLSSGLELVPPDHRNAWRLHTVVAGETLNSVAGRFGVAPSAIAASNNLKSPTASEGDRLLIPAAVRVEAPAARKLHTATARRNTQRRAVTTAAFKPQPATPATGAKSQPKSATSAPKPVSSAIRTQSKPQAPVTKPLPKPAVAATPAAPPAVLLPAGK